MIVRVNNTDYSCLHLTTHINDFSWDMRDNQELLMQMTNAEAIAAFIDGVTWGYLRETDEGTELVDCSAYSIAGDVTDHRNGTVSVKMGKPTAIELELTDAKAALKMLGVE